MKIPRPRRVFYIDVGDMSKEEVQKRLEDVIKKLKNA